MCSSDLLAIRPLIQKIATPIVRKVIISIFNKCSFLMIPYKSLAEDIEERGVKTRKIIIPLGVNSFKFKPAEIKEENKEKIGYNSNDKIIGYCGRISPEKDIQTLVKAYNRLKKDNKNIKLLIVGDGPDFLMREFDKVEGIKITGFVEDVVPYFQAMDIFVMPSLTETTSLATLEAMACGIPVISTKVGHIKDYIFSKFNGLFFGKKNDYLLTKKIEMLLNDNNLAYSLGLNAIKTVEKKYNWNKTIELIKNSFE